jgi:hypothetical protein
MAARRIREARRFQSDTMSVYNRWLSPTTTESELNWWIEFHVNRYKYDAYHFRDAVESIVYDTLSKRYTLLL